MTNLEKILKTRVRDQWKYRVDFGPGEYSKQEIYQWCEKNLKNKWNFQQLYFGYFSFQIEDDHDHLMFMLKWGDNNERIH